jgi:hypothetical protein
MAMETARCLEIVDVTQADGALQRGVVKRGRVVGDVHDVVAEQRTGGGRPPAGQEVVVADPVIGEEAIGGLGLVAIGQGLGDGIKGLIGQVGEQTFEAGVESAVGQRRGRSDLRGPKRRGE